MTRWERAMRIPGYAPSVIAGRTDLPVLLPFRPGARVAPALGGRAAATRWRSVCVALVARRLGIGARAGAAPGVPSILATLSNGRRSSRTGFALQPRDQLPRHGDRHGAGMLLGLAADLAAAARCAASPGSMTQFFRNAPWLVLLFYCMLLLPFQMHVFGHAIVPLPDWIKATFGLVARR